MPLLMGVCDRVYAMHTGSVLTSGTPVEVREHADVVSSYLGTGGVAVHRSGARVPVEARP